MPELPPAIAALIKVFSLGYLLTLLGLGSASLLWRVLRPRLAPALRADAGFILLAGAWLLNTLLAAGIWWGVVNFKILMTTHYFMALMHGGWGNAIAGTGLMVCGVSLMLLAWGWQRGTVPRRLKDRDALGSPPDARGRGLPIRPASGVATVSLVGVIHPEVWVNSDYWQGLSADGRALALAHELTHLQRRDNLRKLLLACIGGLFAVLPGARGWAAQYEQDSELAVDDVCRDRHDECAYRQLVAGALEYLLRGPASSGEDGAMVLQSALAAQSEAPVDSSLGKLLIGRSSLGTADRQNGSTALLARLQILARPRLEAPAGAALRLTLLLTLLCSAHSIALLSHPVPRCLLACYLGY